MKRLKILSAFILIACLLFIFPTACSAKLLSTPSGFIVNDDYKLSWTAIKDARGYTLEIIPVDNSEEEVKQVTSRRAYYSLSNLKEGDYEIKIKAISGTKEYQDSEWSEQFDFHKDYESGCIYTKINNNTEYEVTKVGTANGNVVLGDLYRGKKITKIADGAFKGSGRVEKVTIGQYVKSIGENAFYNCTKLKEVNIPDAVTEIGVASFQNCRSLTNIVIPAGISQIAPYAFAYCRALEEITLTSPLTIEEHAFDNCSSLKNIVIPDTVETIGDSAFSSCTSMVGATIGSNVETIGANSFFNCDELVTVNFSDYGNLNTIGEYAFSDCGKLASIIIPSGVTDIGFSCFYGSPSLSEAIIPSTVSHVGAGAFNGTKIYTDASTDDKLVYAGDWVVAWKASAEEKENLTQLKPETLKRGVVGIADQVFIDSKLISIDLPETVKYIGEYSFARSKSLGRLYTYENDATQESSLQSIGDYAFMGCSILNRVSLNEGLKSIGKKAFYKCTMLDNNKNVSIIPSTVQSIGSDAFKDTALYAKSAEENNGVIYAGEWVVGYSGAKSGAVMLSGINDLNVRGIGDYAFYNCENVTTITLASSSMNTVRYIGRGAFYGCTNLSAVSFSRVLEKIEDYTFYKCSSLFKISFTSNLKSIGRSAFYKCTTLDSIDLSESSVKEIGPYAFYFCSNLKKADLGTDLTSIGMRAFYKCTSLEALDIPNTVTSLGDRAFYNCEGLKTLNIGTGIDAIGDYTFDGCVALENITIPDSVKTIGRYAFYGCTAVTSLKLGNSLETVGDYAFANLGNVRKLQLPDSLISIGKYAFMRCASLSSLTLNKSVESIGAHAFYGCNNLTVYTDSSELLPLWNNLWNSSFRTVIYDCELSEDGAYVKSVTIGEGNIENPKAVNGISSPKREGYMFLGWSTLEDANEAEYTAAQITEVETGVKLYAVWLQESN